MGDGLAESVRSPMGASLGSLYPTGSSLGSLGHPPTSITIADSAVVPRDEISIACDKSVCHSSCGLVARRPVGAKEVRFSEPPTQISLEEIICGLGTGPIIAHHIKRRLGTSLITAQPQA